MIIGIKKFDCAKVLIYRNDKFSDDITLKIVVTLITCITKDGDKFYSQITLEEASVALKISLKNRYGEDMVKKADKKCLVH